MNIKPYVQNFTTDNSGDGGGGEGGNAFICHMEPVAKKDKKIYVCCSPITLFTYKELHIQILND